MTKQLAAHFRKSSSLIILARDRVKLNNKGDFKVLLFNRPENATFMPSSCVFPGGVCETTDEIPFWQKQFEKLGITAEQLELLTLVKTDKTDVVKRDLSLKITAIRETFEELGILLCRDRKSLSLPNGTNGYGNFKEDIDRKHWQTLVHNDSSQFLTLCEKFDIVPDLWNLYEWSSWFTPSTFEKRFNTAFFIVALEVVPDVLPEKNEVKNFTWETPDDYIKAYFDKEILLPPPQVYEISRLLNFTEIEKLKDFARNRASEGSVVNLPVQYKLKNGIVNVLPGDDLYPEDPNAFDLIKLNKEIKEFRDGVRNIHRIEFYNSYDVVVRQNFSPFCGHIKPVMANPKNHE